MKNDEIGLELLNAASSVGVIHLIHQQGEVTVSELRTVSGGYDRLKKYIISALLIAFFSFMRQIMQPGELSAEF